MNTVYKATILFSLCGIQYANANEQNVDITLVQPSFSTVGIPGLNNVGGQEYGYFRYGVQSFWVRDPLVYLENNIDQGAVVSRRLQPGWIRIRLFKPHRRTCFYACCISMGN